MWTTRVCIAAALAAVVVAWQPTNCLMTSRSRRSYRGLVKCETDMRTHAHKPCTRGRTPTRTPTTRAHSRPLVHLQLHPPNPGERETWRELGGGIYFCRREERTGSSRLECKFYYSFRRLRNYFVWSALFGAFFTVIKQRLPFLQEARQIPQRRG